MLFTKYGTRLAVIWIVLFAAFAGCQTDSVNAPVPSATSQQINGQATGGQTVDGTTPAVGGIGTPQSLFGNLLRIVAGIVTPLNGGTLNLQTSRLEIYPLAVLTPKLVTFTMITTTPSGLPGALNKVFEFTPHGLNFLVSSKLFVSFVDAGLGNRNPNEYRCYYFNENTNAWEPQPTTVDVANQRFVVTLEHFSRYAFGR